MCVAVRVSPPAATDGIAPALNKIISMLSCLRKQMREQFVATNARVTHDTATMM